MRFAFRVDSSPIIGMGHLMRCLTLANGLRKRGFKCSFICRDFEGNGASRFIGDGFPLELISIEGLELSEDWLGVPFEEDVKDTIDIISKEPVDWLIIDHYEIDRRWETEFRNKFPKTKIMVIDDLVRSHDCDLLLDQTYGRTADEYRPVVPENTQLCLGTEFALLRDDFSRLRAEASKADGESCHVLVTLGGGNQGKPLRVIGKALRELSKKYEFTATVITGDVPDLHLEDYKALGQNIELISFSNNIAAEMTRADFVIGAGGGTSWERCCLGLPTVVLTIADNQIEIAKILNDKEAGFSVATEQNEIAKAVETLLTNPELLARISKNAASLCDGKGVIRVINTILATSFEIRQASLSDARFIYVTRYADDASQYYKIQDIPDFDAHSSWMKNALQSDKKLLLCVVLNGDNLAHIRLDYPCDDQGKNELSIYLNSKYKRKGLGRFVLRAALKYLNEKGINEIYAKVMRENYPSIRIFKAEGFSCIKSADAKFVDFLWTKNAQYFKIQ